MSNTVVFVLVCFVFALACPQSFYLPIRNSSIIQKVQWGEHTSLATCVPVLAVSVVTVCKT